MTTESDAVKDAIADVAVNPKKVKGDEGEIEEYSIEDLIKAQRFLANRSAITNGGGFRLTKIKAPGAEV